VDCDSIVSFASSLMKHGGEKSQLLRPLSGQLVALAMVAAEQAQGIPTHYKHHPHWAPNLRDAVTGMLSMGVDESNVDCSKEEEFTPQLESTLYCLMTMAQRHSRVALPCILVFLPNLIRLVSNVNKEVLCDLLNLES